MSNNQRRASQRRSVQCVLCHRRQRLSDEVAEILDSGEYELQAHLCSSCEAEHGKPLGMAYACQDHADEADNDPRPDCQAFCFVLAGCCREHDQGQFANIMHSPVH